MKHFVLAFFACFFFLNSASAQPSWLAALGKMIPTHGYASVANAEFIIDYYDESLPWGTEVVFHYAFEKSEFQNGDLRPVETWSELKVEPVSAVGPFKWGKKFEKTLFSRGSSTQLTRLNFFIEVRLPSGEKRFLPEGALNGQYWSANRPIDQKDCNPWGDDYCMLTRELRN